MKRIALVSILFFAALNFNAFTQSDDENTIRKLSALEVDAFLKTDTVALAKLWAPSYVVMNPFNKIVTPKEIKALMRTMKVNQVRFERIIDKITIIQNIATEMGQEVPDQKTASAGVAQQVLTPRRFTNVWMRHDNSWQVVARQATNVCP